MTEVDLRLSRVQMEIIAALRGLPPRTIDMTTMRDNGITLTYGDRGTIRILRSNGTGDAKQYEFPLIDVVALARAARLSLNAEEDEARLLRIEEYQSQHREPHQLARKSDHATSKQAARVIAGMLSPIQERVMSAFQLAGARGLTDFELDQNLGGQNSSTYRTRRQELTAAGKIVNTGETRVVDGAGDRARIVWKLAP